MTTHVQPGCAFVLGAIALVCLFVNGMANAALITVPVGLNPGDQYRLAFVTSTSRLATNTDINDYNTYVSTAAGNIPELAAMGTTWTAIGSTSATAARDNTGTNPTVETGVPTYRLDGVLIANDNADLWDGSLQASLSLTETGTPYSGNVWTGTKTDGTPTTAFYPLGQPLQSVGWGLASSSTGTWIEDFGAGPLNPRPIYGISDVLVAIPEPNSLVLVMLATLGLFVLRKGK